MKRTKPINMKLDYWRDCAIGVARSKIRDMGADPANIDAGFALNVLGDMALAEKEPYYWAEWYRRASKHQTQLFCRDWRIWQKRQRRNWL